MRIRKNKNTLIRSAMAALLLVSAAAFADNGGEQARPEHWLTQYRHALDATRIADGKSMHGAIQFVVGNELWQQGEQFVSGKDWLALSCVQSNCALEPASLTVSKENWQGHYDDSPTSGQRLHFAMVTPSKSKVIAWFHTSHAPAWLKPGNISTYYSGAGRPKMTDGDTMEAQIDLPDGSHATFVPLVLSPTLSPDLVAYYWGENSPSPSPIFLLQLRAQGKRQLVLGQLGACDHGVDGKASYLLWAGDLDGDGKPDYLISFADTGEPVQLYLSGAARPDELVGLAGWHDSPAYDSECVGDGWGL